MNADLFSPRRRSLLQMAALSTLPWGERVWAQAINNALDKRGKALGRMGALEELAEKLLVQCDEGDMTALKELGDRLDGKAVQAIAGDKDAPLNIQILRFAEVEEYANQTSG